MGDGGKIGAIGFEHERAVWCGGGGGGGVRGFWVGDDPAEADEVAGGDHGSGGFPWVEPAVEDAAEFSVPWGDAGADGVPAGEAGAVALVDDDIETGFGGEGELGFEEGGLAVVVGGFGPAVGGRVVEVHAGFADADAARVSGEGAELVEPVGVGDLGDVGGVDPDGGFDGWVLFGEMEAGAAGDEVAADGDDAGDAGGGGA